MSKANWSKENLEKIVKESYSNAEVIRALGLKEAGGSYSHLKKYLKEYQIDTSHFSGQRWQKNPKLTDEDKMLNKLTDILKENTNYGSDNLRKRLVAAQLKENKCEICGITEWNSKPAPLELHHINGNHYDNRLENLQVLCCNCHAQTDTYKRRMRVRTNPNTIHIKEVPTRISKQKTLIEKHCANPNCNKLFIPSKRTQKYCCQKCASEGRKIELSNNSDAQIITRESLIEGAKTVNNIKALADKFNTSRTTIRKYLDQFGLLEEFKAKFDFRAIPVVQYDMNMNIIKEWPSTSDAEETLNLTDISRCCKFKRKSCGGYIWRYKEI